MEKLTTSLLIDFLEETTSEDQSKDILNHLNCYPYYKDILLGLQLDLFELGNKDAVLKNIQSRKEKTQNALFPDMTSKTTTL